MRNLFPLRYSSPQGVIPGQGPRLIHQIRQQPRIDTTAFSRLSQMPRATSPLDPVGSMRGATIDGKLHGVVAPIADMPIRHPQQVAAGLGLPLESEQELTRQVEEWITAPDPIAFRRSLHKGLRSLAPGDYRRRNIIAKRCMQLWKMTAREGPWDRSPQHAIVQKSEGELAGLEPTEDQRRRMRLTISRPQPMELVWMTRELDEIGDSAPVVTPPGWTAEELAKKYADRIREAARAYHTGSSSGPPGEDAAAAEWVAQREARRLEAEEHRQSRREGRDRRQGLVIKAASHKYVKRTRNPSAPPNYRYFYSQPKGKGLTSSADLHAGAKFKVEHAGEEGHFEVTSHDKDKGIVHVKHDESGRVAHIRERDLHRMISAYHAGKTAAAQGKPAPKIPKRLKVATMADLQNGEYDGIEGFGTPEDLERQAAAGKKDRDYSIIAQAGGHVLVFKLKREVGAKRELKGEKVELKLRAATGKGIDTVQGEYVIVEADDLVASHKPRDLANFPVNPAYPENVQERRYHAISSEREKVDRIAKHLDSAILVNTNPDAVNGAPIVDQNMAVLGGNARTMAIQMAYEDYPDSAKRLKDYLIANARKYGVNAADVRAMKRPALARRIQVDPGENNEKLKLLGRRMNEALTLGLDPRSEEVAVAQFVTKNVTQALVDTIEPDQTLADFLYSAGSADFVVALRQAGIIDDYNKVQYLEHDSRGEAVNHLNEAGRDRVERVMAARMIPDADTLSTMNPEMRKVLALSTPSLIVAEEHGWPVGDSLQLAVEADLHIRSQYPGKKADVALTDFLTQVEAKDVLDVAKRVHEDPVGLALLKIIRGKIGTKKTPKDFRGVALRAVQDHQEHAFTEGAGEMSGQLFAAAPPLGSDSDKAKKRRMDAMADALDIEFGITPERGKAKVRREKEAREHAKKLKEAEARRTVAAADQPAMFLSTGPRFWNGNAWEPYDLVKAEKRQNRLLSRAIIHAQLLVDAAIHRSTSCSRDRKPKVNVARIVDIVMEDVRTAVEKDPALAADLGAQPITAATIQGIVETMCAMRPTEVAKALATTNDMTKAHMKPPGSGWTPPSGKRKSWRKLGGKGYVYWAPRQGLHSSVVNLFGESEEIPSTTKGAAAGMADDVDHMNEVHRATTIADRVERDFGTALPPKAKAEIGGYRKNLADLKRRIANSRDLHAIHEYQDQARALAHDAADSLRELELRQVSMFEPAPPDVEEKELTVDQVKEHARVAYSLGAAKDPGQFSRYMSNLVETSGPVEARRVMDQIKHLQESRRGEATVRAPAPPPKPRPEPKQVSRSVGEQASLFSGHQATAAGEAGTLFRSRRLVLGR